MARVRTGLERLLAGEVDSLRGKRVGLVANPTSVDPALGHAVDLLHQSDFLTLAALFGPEHGLRGDAQDMIAVGSEDRDPRTGLPIYSLYGHDVASLAPPAGSLDGLDALVFDIQDIGSRYYTYVWTMVCVMRACARDHLRMVVLDRPNPIGDAVEGGEVTEPCRSFVGLLSVPNRHGLTAGEIARMAVDVEQLDLDLEVIAVKGWRPEAMFDQTGLPWVLPSPNMPTLDTALVYPGMCLLEGTELSEGRGTTRPFEIAGAPFVDGHALAEALSGESLPGVTFRPLTFRPTFQKHAGVPCGGVQLHVTDRASFRPYLTGVAFVRAVHMLWPDEFAWRRRAYEFVDEIPAIDLLAGSPAVREGIERGDSLADLTSTWSEAEDEFLDARDRWRLYR